jgi:RNA polymerase sigma-70 factor (sigma-E family)
VRSDSASVGDRDGFRVFVARVSPALMRSAYVLTGDRGQAEDLLQAALWRVAQRWAAIEGSPDAYAHRVLINLSRDRRRWLGRRAREVVRVDPPAAVLDDVAAVVAQRDWLVQGIGRLPRRQREVVVLRFLLDLSVEQTAAVLGATQGTVKSHSSRALSQLRELLTEQSEGPDHLHREVRHAD